MNMIIKSCKKKQMTMRKITIAACLFLAGIINAQQVGINTKNPQATLHVNGNIKVTTIPVLANARALAVDVTGHIGTTNQMSKILFVQSTASQLYASTDPIVASFNNATPIVVKWTSSDLIMNDMMTFNSDDNSFSFKQSGIYEIGGYINYVAGAKMPSALPEISSITQNLIALNVTIQLFQPLTNSWKNVAGVRYLLSGPGLSNSTRTIMIPTVAYHFDTNDKIRVAFYRPLPNFATPHGTFSDFGIRIPKGLIFSKGLKVSLSNI